MAVAVKNIETFHNAQQLQAVDAETLPAYASRVTLPHRPSAIYSPAARRAAVLNGVDARNASTHAGCQQVLCPAAADC